MRKRLPESTWKEIFAAHAAGIGLREIARNMGIAPGTICARSKREDWTRKLTDARALAAAQQAPAISTAQGVATSLYERGLRHVDKMADVVERTMPRVESMDADEVLDNVERIDRYDRLARRNYGIDEQGVGGPKTLNINFLSDPGIFEVRRPVIGAETGQV